MSVFTLIERSQLEEFLSHFELGRLLSFAGIEAGIDNTNYFVTTSAGAYVLTIFELLEFEEIDFFLELMAHLAHRGTRCAEPVAGRDGRLLHHLLGKPAALVERLPGASVTAPTSAQCSAVGAAMAHMHLAARDFQGQRSDDRGRDWRRSMADKLAGHAGREETDLIAELMRELDIDTQAELPHGVIHADLFRDNALFVGAELTGIIDFYYARTGSLIYDLAITVADWCFIPHGCLDATHGRALLNAYHQVRPLEKAEREAWAWAFRAAGARFWLSRLHDLHFPRDGLLTHSKDPGPFKKVFIFGREHPDLLERLWPGVKKSPP